MKRLDALSKDLVRMAVRMYTKLREHGQYISPIVSIGRRTGRRKALLP